MKEQPDVLNEEEAIRRISVNIIGDFATISPKCHREVQRDADIAHYEPEIRQRGLLAVALLNVLRKAGMLNYDTCPNGAELLMFAEEFCEHNPIQQARQEVAREIFEVYDAYIESLGSDLNKLTQLVIKHEREHKAKILSLKGRFPKEAV